MNANDPNVVLLELVAQKLGEDLRQSLVFVGGAVVGLLVTDPAMPPIRPTTDVDLICEALVHADYHRIEARLRDRGFVHDASHEAPICRWRIGSVAVDVMPNLQDILGFSNRWYDAALVTAEPVNLPSGLQIRLVAAPAFLATKFEAFDGRGRRDYLSSHDLGDLLAVVDGRDSLLQECRNSPTAIRRFLASRFSGLLETAAFMDALPGHLPGDASNQARLPDLERKLAALASLQ